MTTPPGANPAQPPAAPTGWRDVGGSQVGLTDRLLSAYQIDPGAAAQYQNDRGYLADNGADVGRLDNHFQVIKYLNSQADPSAAFQALAPKMRAAGYDLGMVSSHLPGGYAYSQAHHPGLGQRFKSGLESAGALPGQVLPKLGAEAEEFAAEPKRPAPPIAGPPPPGVPVGQWQTEQEIARSLHENPPEGGSPFAAPAQVALHGLGELLQAPAAPTVTGRLARAATGMVTAAAPQFTEGLANDVTGVAQALRLGGRTALPAAGRLVGGIAGAYAGEPAASRLAKLAGVGPAGQQLAGTAGMLGGALAGERLGNELGWRAVPEIGPEPARPIIRDVTPQAQPVQTAPLGLPEAPAPRAPMGRRLPPYRGPEETIPTPASSIAAPLELPASRVTAHQPASTLTEPLALPPYIAPPAPTPAPPRGRVPLGLPPSPVPPIFVGSPQGVAITPQGAAVRPEAQARTGRVEVTAPTVMTHAANVKAGGGEFAGLMESGIPGQGDLVLFNDPVTRSTLALPESQVTPQAVAARIAENRKRFESGTAPVAGAPVPPAPPQPNAAAAQPPRTAAPAATPAARANGAPGAATAVKTPGGDLPARYVVVEASSLTPSHNAGTFAPNPNYPAGVQERDYQQSPEAKARVVGQARDLKPEFLISDNPDAVNGPPVVTPGGVVLGGNSRTMSLQRAYGAGGANAYKNALAKQATHYGLTPAAVKAMKQPVLVRVVGEPANVEEARRLGSDLNRPFTAALSPSELAASRGKAVSQETMEALGAALDAHPDLSLRDLLREQPKLFLDRLEADGVITPQERPAWVNQKTGALSDAGRAFTEKALLGSAIPDSRVLDAAPPSAVNKIAGALAPIARLKAAGGAWDITPKLTEALELKGYQAARGLSTDELLSQSQLFGGAPEPEVAALVRALDEKPTEFRRKLKDLAQASEMSRGGQGMLIGKAPTAQQAFADAFGEKAPTLARTFAAQPATAGAEPASRLFALPAGEPNALERAPTLPSPVVWHQPAGEPFPALYFRPGSEAIGMIRDALNEIGVELGREEGQFGGFALSPSEGRRLVAVANAGAPAAKKLLEGAPDLSNGAAVVVHAGTPESTRAARLEEMAHLWQMHADAGAAQQAIAPRDAIAILYTPAFHPAYEALLKAYGKEVEAIAGEPPISAQRAILAFQHLAAELGAKLIIGNYRDLELDERTGEQAAQTYANMVLRRWPDAAQRTTGRVAAELRRRTAGLLTPDGGRAPGHQPPTSADGGPAGGNPPGRAYAGGGPAEGKAAAPARIGSDHAKDQALAAAVRDWLAKLQATGRPAMASGREGLTPGFAVTFQPRNGGYVASPRHELSPGEYQELAEAFAAEIGNAPWRDHYSANALAEARRRELRATAKETDQSPAVAVTPEQLHLFSDAGVQFSPWGRNAPQAVGNPATTVTQYHQSGRGPGVVVVGAPGHVILQAAGMFPAGDPGFGGYGGFSVGLGRTRHVIGVLRAIEAAVRASGNELGAELAARTADALEAAAHQAGSSSRGIVVVAAGQGGPAVRRVLREEIFHGKQRGLGGSVPGHISEAGATALLADEVGARARAQLAEIGYPVEHMPPGGTVAEIGAKIAAGALDELGLSRAQAAKWFTKYWHQLRTEHGAVRADRLYLHQVAREAILDAEQNTGRQGENREQLGPPGAGGGDGRSPGRGEGVDGDRGGEPPSFALARGRQEPEAVRANADNGAGQSAPRSGNISRLASAADKLAAPVKALDAFLSKYGGISPEAKTKFKNYEGGNEMRAVQMNRLARDMYGAVFDTLGPNWDKDQASLLKIERNIVRPDDQRFALTPAEQKVKGMLLALRDRITLHDVARGWLTPAALDKTNIRSVKDAPWLTAEQQRDLLAALGAWHELRQAAPGATPEQIRAAARANPEALDKALDPLPEAAVKLVHKWIEAASPGVDVPYWPGSYTDDAAKVAKFKNQGAPNPNAVPPLGVRPSNYKGRIYRDLVAGEESGLHQNPDAVQVILQRLDKSLSAANAADLLRGLGELKTGEVESVPYSPYRGRQQPVVPPGWALASTLKAVRSKLGIAEMAPGEDDLLVSKNLARTLEEVIPGRREEPGGWALAGRIAWTLQRAFNFWNILKHPVNIGSNAVLEGWVEGTKALAHGDFAKAASDAKIAASPLSFLLDPDVRQALKHRDGAFYDRAIKAGAIRSDLGREIGFGAHEVPRTERIVQKAREEVFGGDTTGLVGVLKKAVDLGANLGHRLVFDYFDTAVRLKMFKELVAQGLSDGEAARRVNQALIDYGDVRRGPGSLPNRVLYTLPWIKGNFKAQASFWKRNPIAMLLTMGATFGLAEWINHERTGHGMAANPPGLQDRFASGAAPNGMTRYSRITLPYLMPVEAATHPVEFAYNRLDPNLRAGIAGGTGENYPPMSVPNLLAHEPGADWPILPKADRDAMSAGEYGPAALDELRMLGHNIAPGIFSDVGGAVSGRRAAMDLALPTATRTYNPYLDFSDAVERADEIRARIAGLGRRGQDNPSLDKALVTTVAAANQALGRAVAQWQAHPPTGADAAREASSLSYNYRQLQRARRMAEAVGGPR